MATKNQRTTPAEIETDKNLIAGVAWDNYDRYVETVNRKCSLHNTVGICFQNNPTEFSATEEIENTNNPNTENELQRNKKIPTKSRKI